MAFGFFTCRAVMTMILWIRRINFHQATTFPSKMTPSGSDNWQLANMTKSQSWLKTAKHALFRFDAGKGPASMDHTLALPETKTVPEGSSIVLTLG